MNSRDSTRQDGTGRHPAPSSSSAPAVSAPPISLAAPLDQNSLLSSNLEENVRYRAALTPGLPQPLPSTSRCLQPLPSTSQATGDFDESHMLFTSFIHYNYNPTLAGSATGSNPVAGPSRTLNEAAAVFEEIRTNKRKYEEVETFTGEEGEVNVLQLSCKLYVFDTARGTWLERSVGTLRLNDKESEEGVQSRLVMRTTGTLKVTLNTKVWGGMAVDRVSAKQIRLTAMDGTGRVRLFVIHNQGNPEDMENLQTLLEARVDFRAAVEAGSEPMPKRRATGGPSTSTAL